MAGGTADIDQSSIKNQYIKPFWCFDLKYTNCFADEWTLLNTCPLQLSQAAGLTGLPHNAVIDSKRRIPFRFCTNAKFSLSAAI